MSYLMCNAQNRNLIVLDVKNQTRSFIILKVFSLCMIDFSQNFMFLLKTVKIPSRPATVTRIIRGPEMPELDK